MRNNTVVTAAILLLGSIIRLLPLAYVDSRLPYRMGGLYVEFAQQIAAHHFSLPARIPYYTEGGIPFAYPPLPFYVQAAILQTFPSSEFVIANLLPPITAIAALLSFVLLIQALELQPLTGTIALAAFATLPSAYYEQLESAGLAEAFGSLTLILFSTLLARVYYSGKPVFDLLAGLAFGLCILASPASAYAAFLLFALFTAIKLFNTKEPRFAILGRLTAVGIIGVLIAGPYLLSVIQNHGVGLFINVLRAQSASPMRDLPFPGWLSPFFDFNASGAPYPFIWDFIVFSGLIWAILLRQWWLLLWYLAMFAVPREGWWIASIPASLLVGFGVMEVWFPFASAAGKGLSMVERRVIYFALAILFCSYALMNARAIIFQDILKGYQREHWVNMIAAGEWVKLSTPPDSRLIVIFEREAKEWIPHITQRTVLNNKYGAEWEPAEHQDIIKLEDDLGDCSTLPCIRQAAEKFTPNKDWYGLFEKKGIKGLSKPKRIREAGFEPLWENNEVIIIQFTGGVQP